MSYSRLQQSKFEHHFEQLLTHSCCSYCKIEKMLRAKVSFVQAEIFSNSLCSLSMMHSTSMGQLNFEYTSVIK